MISLSCSRRGLFSKALLVGLIVTLNQVGFSQLVCQISGAPIVQTGALTPGDPTQTGRINRNGITGSCPTGKTNALFNSTPVVQDNYTFNAPVTGCATVAFDATQCTGATTQVVAYSTFNPATPGANVIGDFGFSTTATASFSFPVTQGQNYTVVVHDILESPTNLFCPNYTFTVTYRQNCRQPGFDQTNDGQADPVVFRPSTGDWLTLNSAGGTLTQNFGLSSDILTPGDYTGDGQTDVSVYRPSTNVWYYGNNTVNPGQNFTAAQWGVAGDRPVPGDYDGDGKNDVAIWRPSDGFWYVLRSSNSTVDFVQWGRNGDIPAPADYDGDHLTDRVVVRPDKVGITPNYRWYQRLTNFNFGFSLVSSWGIVGDIVVPGDYDGNGKADVTVFRPSNGVWYTVPSVAQNAVATTSSGFQWGTAGDIPQPADYDGDGRTDYAVFRPSTGTWFISNSNNGTYDSFDSPVWGVSTDRPATAAFAVSP